MLRTAFTQLHRHSPTVIPTRVAIFAKILREISVFHEIWLKFREIWLILSWSRKHYSWNGSYRVWIHRDLYADFNLCGKMLTNKVKIVKTANKNAFSKNNLRYFFLIKKCSKKCQLFNRYTLIHGACPYCMSCLLSVSCLRAACLYCVFTLHVRYMLNVCLGCMPMLYVHVACPWCMAMLLVNTYIYEIYNIYT
jgi:hypothetical protein